MNILITGASGQIGQVLVPQLQKNGYYTLCQSRSHQDKTYGDFWFQNDFQEQNWPIFDQFSIDIIIHLASITSPDAYIFDPVEIFKANVIGTLNLIEAARTDQKNIFFLNISSATVSGSRKNKPLNYFSSTHPESFYDLTKVSVEDILHHYVSCGYVDGCSLRLANVYGFPTPNSQSGRSALDKIYWSSKAGKGVQIYGTGEYLRDYIHIDDVVSAILLSIANRKSINHKKLFLGTGEANQVKEAFLKVAAVALGCSKDQVPHRFVSFPKNSTRLDQRNSVVDPSLFRKLTGWMPQLSFEEGIKKYNDY